MPISKFASAMVPGPRSVRPKDAVIAGSAFLHNYLRDSFTIQTWLLLGGLLQIVLFSLPIHTLYTIIPVVTLLTWQIVDNLLMTLGLKRNVYMQGVIPGKTTALFPNGSWGADGEVKDGKGAPGGGGMVVFILGAKCNHPLGYLAPGFKKAQEYFLNMLKDLDSNADEYGYMGATSRLGAADQTTSNEITTIMYFKSMAQLDKFSHSKSHRAGWDWWNREVKSLGHVSLMHELYEVKEGGWETIYLNYRPDLLATTTHPITDSDGQRKWASPVVDASRGKLRSSKGRLGIDDGADDEKSGVEPYEA